MRFLALEKLINLHDGYRQTIKVDSLEVVLIQEMGELFIIQSRCPHQGQNLETGIVSNGKIYCPWHNFAFDLATGQHAGGGCEPLSTYTPIFHDKLLGIMIND